MDDVDGAGWLSWSMSVVRVKSVLMTDDSVVRWLHVCLSVRCA